MRCAHCCMAATHNGADMSMEVFQTACALGEEYGIEHVALGGGEPTLHPRLFEMIGIALAHFDTVWMATNGKLTDVAWRLFKMAKRGHICVDLSLDRFHSRINKSLADAFQEEQKKRYSNFRSYGEPAPRSRAGVRSVSTILAAGRARKTGVATTTDRCPCPELYVDPRGRLWSCGCKGKSFGTVYAPKIDGVYLDGDCYAAERDIEEEVYQLDENLEKSGK